ncbi:MAG: serine hydrolase domain-containing protein [Chitinophagaceae bacterium]
MLTLIIISKSWKFPYDSLSGNKKITLANLLSHSAGLSVHGFAGYTPGDTLPTIFQILNGQKPANSPAIRSEFEPSKKFQYSGGGTTISQLMLTETSGMKYEDFLKKEVLTPIGMTNSFFNQPPPPGTKELATAYYGSSELKGKYHVYPEQAAAGLWTTPTDLAKYIVETQLELEGKSSKVLNKQLIIKRFTPYIDSSVALGVFIVNKGEKYFNHNGGNEGFLSSYYGSFEGGNGVVVMINSDNFNIIPEIINSVAQVYNWKGFYNPVIKKTFSIPKDTLLSYTGRYLLMKDTISVDICNNDQTQLCARQNGQPANGFKMIPTGNHEFSLQEVPGLLVKILFDKDGRPDALEVNQNGQQIRAPRIKQ